jgi:N,N'-diacetyllegionaminate synthase
VTSVRPMLIAECCQNHNGDREILRRMIHEAAEAGADHVKLQSIRSRDLTLRERFEEGEIGPDGEPRTIKRPYGPELERLAKLDLTLADEAWFVEECRRAGVAPMTTVFTRAGVLEVEGLGYEAVKIASYDCASYPLLRDVRSRWSTIVVSTGATFDEEIERAADVLAGAEYTFLHCVTIYPTPLDELHLGRMGFLRRFTPRVGYSDHTRPAETGLWASKLALALGATCVERHFTILPADRSKDGPVSITPELLRELRAFADLSRPERMKQIRAGFPEWEGAVGQARRPLSSEELRNRDYYRGRFASKVDGRDVYNWEDEPVPPPTGARRARAGAPSSGRSR